VEGVELVDERAPVEVGPDPSDRLIEPEPKLELLGGHGCGHAPSLSVVERRRVPTSSPLGRTRTWAKSTDREWGPRRPRSASLPSTKGGCRAEQRRQTTVGRGADAPRPGGSAPPSAEGTARPPRGSAVLAGLLPPMDRHPRGRVDPRPP